MLSELQAARVAEAAQPTLINLAALDAAPLNDDPFPFVVVPNFLAAAHAETILRDFPDIKARGSFPLTQLAGGPSFRRLTDELASAELRTAIEEKFSIDLSDRYTMITVRGMTERRDGRIHTDTKSKFLTLLLYLNPTWQMEGGRLRILRNGRDLNNYVCEIPPVFGTCLIFKVTENCWHGHKPVEGVRRSLQLNYIRDEAALRRHLLRHNLTARLKNLKRLFANDSY
jgi:SM-20-related protein